MNITNGAELSMFQIIHFLIYASTEKLTALLSLKLLFDYPELAEKQPVTFYRLSVPS